MSLSTGAEPQAPGASHLKEEGGWGQHKALETGGRAGKWGRGAVMRASCGWALSLAR